MVANDYIQLPCSVYGTKTAAARAISVCRCASVLRMGVIYLPDGESRMQVFFPLQGRETLSGTRLVEEEEGGRDSYVILMLIE